MKSLLALLCLLVPVVLHAQGMEPRLTVELLPPTIAVAPGKTTTVALKLKHIEHGHSYWKNPGATGFPTTFTWTLPDGVTASAPQWPVPTAQVLAGAMSYAFEGETMVFVDITAAASVPANQENKISVKTNALVCTDSCKPETVTTNGTLSTSDVVPLLNAKTTEAIAKGRKLLPIAPKSWSITAEKVGAQFAISLMADAGANKNLTKAYFFSEVPFPENDIDPEKPQELKKEGDRWLLLLTPTTDNAPKDKLAGVIFAEEGWLESDREVKGFEVKLTIGAPATKAATPITEKPAAAASGTGGYGTGTLLIFAFLGGLILNIMPCVFPVLGIKIMGFVQQAGEDRQKIFLHGVAYALGVLMCFWVLALLAIFLGRSWGYQLQSPGFVLLLCYFFMAFGLNMAGVFEIGASAVGVGQELQNASGFKGSFFQGLLATVVATPCSAPFLGPALTWAVSLSPVLSLSVFTVIGLGLSSPYLVLSLAPALVKLLPRPGAWMESFKQAMSFLLFGTVGYMLWTFAGMVEEWHLLMTMFGLVLVAMACWIYGRWCLPHKKPGTRAKALVMVAIALLSAFWLGWPTAGVAASSNASNTESASLKWEAWSPELVQKLRDEGKPVYIDFTARWCATCQFNKRLYHDDRIASLIRQKGIVLLKADYTNYDERIKTTIRDVYHREAVPVNVLYIPGETEPMIFDVALTIGSLTEAFSRIK